MNKCMIKNCKRNATHRAEFELHPLEESLTSKEKRNYEPAVIDGGIEVCNVHTTYDAYDVLTETRFTQMVLEVHKQGGSIAIDRDRIGLDWRPNENGRIDEINISTRDGVSSQTYRS